MLPRDLYREHSYRLLKMKKDICVRSINVSLSGRFSKPFLKLSACCLRSSSSWADCSALDLGGQLLKHCGD